MSSFELTEDFLNDYRWYGDLRAKQVRDEVADLTDSPIEARLLVAMVLHAIEAKLAFNVVDKAADPASAPHLYVAPQRKLAAYRVDFLVGNNVTNKHVVVECDGADFHQEQIERDRKRDGDVEALGFKVMRFPGKEIHAVPFHVAGQVWDEVAREEHTDWLRSIASHLG